MFVRPHYHQTTTVIVNTGGTIASVDSADSVETTVLSPHEQHIQALINQLKHHSSDFPHEITAITVCNKDSSAFDLKDTHRINNLVGDLLADENVHSVIITHGTDTLEENAFFTDINLNPQKPVIYTGAMYNSSHRKSDGWNNLVNSLHDVLTVSSSTWIRMGNDCIPAQGAYKTCTGFASISSPEDQIALEPLERPVICRPQIPILVATLDTPAQVWRAMLDVCDGAVIEALGNGNLSPDIIAMIAQYALKIPILIVSRVFKMPVGPVYAPGRDVLEAGAMYVNGIPPAQLRILLIELLRRQYSMENIRLFFHKRAQTFE